MNMAKIKPKLNSKILKDEIEKDCRRSLSKQGDVWEK